MSIKNIFHKFTKWLGVYAIAATFAGCTMVTDDLPECPAQLRVKFVYDYNLKFADAFSHEVKSVNVWAFDRTGSLVWSAEASGEALQSPNFVLDTPLTEGVYDFVSWCNLDDNQAFTLQSYTPSSKEELIVKLNTINKDGLHVSDKYIPGLYHGTMSGVNYDIDPQAPSFKTVTIPLMKDTKDIRIMLQHLDGSPIENRDFTVTLTDANSIMNWNNSIVAGCPVVSYQPWNVKYGQVTAPGENEGNRDITTVAALMFEISTGRLMVDSNAILTVHRNWDNRDIIRIPLIDYLLLVKGHYGDISDQDYLDRQDDYSIVFFIDPNSNWYLSAGIFVNNWAVVPPQENPL